MIKYGSFVFRKTKQSSYCSGSRIIRTKICEHFMRIKQNVRSKPVESMGKRTIVRIIRDVRTSEGQVIGLHCVTEGTSNFHPNEVV